MTWDQFKTQLAREARDYLRELRELKEDLKSAEGLLALGLLLMSIAIVAIWMFVSIGFNPANGPTTAFIYSLGLRPCRPIDNPSGVFLFIDMILMLFLIVVTLGNVITMNGEVKRGLPRRPRDLIVSTSLMLVVGISGILYMIWIC